MSKDLKQLIAATALKNMFQGNYFDYSCVQEVAKMLGIKPNAEAMDMLHPLHCVHWTKMPRELFQQMPGLISKALMDGIDINSVQPTAEPTTTAKPLTFWRRA